jgi:GntR family transcriptional repressor for pyruvate dehydrogenase complex
MLFARPAGREYLWNVERRAAADPGVEGPALEAVFKPVDPPTTFEETVERLGTAIRLGLLPPGRRLPPERDLAGQLRISRSTLRQAITTLVESGHVVSLRGRTGGTFVVEAPPLSGTAEEPLGEEARAVLDYRVAVETGATLLAAERAEEKELELLDSLVARMSNPEGFEDYRRADVRFHIGLAEAARSPRLVSAMTEVQGQVSDLIARIPHPQQVLTRSNAQHGRLVALLRAGEAAAAVVLIREHIEGTEHILAGLM